MKAKTILLTGLLAGLLAALGAAAPISAQSGADEQRYTDCMDLALRAPDKAINRALVWQNEQGGIPARHCEALGLFYLREYEEAAARLERIAEDMRIGKDMPVRGSKRMVATAPMLADMYGQAANAWLLASEIVRAETAIDIALSLTVNGSSQELELIVDRARIAAADQDFSLALEDLEKVQRQDPGRKDILVLIAAAARGVGDFGKAGRALDEYLQLFPERTDGYLEKGNLYDVQGLTEEARKSWLKVVSMAEQGPDVDAARANLERIDLAKE